MWPVSPLWEAAVRSSHVIELRVDAYQNGVLVAPDLPVDPESGTLIVDGESPVRRTVDLTISDPSLVPTGRDSLLTPYRTDLLIRRGFRFPDGRTELVPLGLFRIIRPATPLYGGVAVSGADQAKLIQDDTFTRTETLAIGATHTEEIDRLIIWSLGGGTPISITAGALAGDRVLPSRRIVWEQGLSLLDAIGELALAIDCEVYADPEGTFIVRPIPRLAGEPVWTIDIGEMGVIVEATEAWDREDIFNAAIVRGETADGSPPVYWTAGDQNPNSPTYWNGPFGHRCRPPYVSPFITTTVQALRTAETLLWRGIAPTRSITAQVVPNPALEPGDVVAVHLPGTSPRQDLRRELHMVRGYTLPLGLGPMELELYTPDVVI